MRISSENRNYHSKISTQSGQNFRKINIEHRIFAPLIIISPGNHCVSCALKHIHPVFCPKSGGAANGQNI